MTQETAKIKLSNEEDTLESIAIAFGSPMVSEEFRAEVGHILEKSEKYHGIFTLSDYPTSTGKLSVEKLKEKLNTAKKALTEAEKMYQKQMDRFINSEMNESARSHCENQLKLLSPAHKAYEALAAIGGLE